MKDGDAIEGNFDKIKKTTNSLLIDRFVSAIGISLFCLAMYLIYLGYRPLVPANTMRAWVIIASIIIFVVIVYNILLNIVNPTVEAQLKYWREIDRWLTFGFDLISFLVIVLLFPHANAAMKLLTIVIYVAYMPTNIILDPGRESSAQISILLLIGALAFELMQNRTFADIALSILLIAYGAVMFIGAGSIRKAVQLAVTRHEEAEHAKKNLELAVKEIAAERDAKTRFIAAVSHDLGQPIQAANLFVEQIIRAPNQGAREQAATGARRSFEAAEDLIGHMLNYLRLEADAVRPNFTEIDCVKLAQDVTARYIQTNQQIEFIFENSHKDIIAKLDRSLIERALGNLIANALMHSNCSKIVLRVIKNTNKSVNFEIIDNGSGIEAADAEKIFEDYFQGKATKSEMRGGFGLGLASVRRLIKLMNGSVWLDTSWHKGARFIINLPLYPTKDIDGFRL